MTIEEEKKLIAKYAEEMANYFEPRCGFNEAKELLEGFLNELRK